MLARLQQITTLGTILLALLWAAWGWQSGHGGWGMAGSLFIICGYAAVLAAEFVLLGLAHGHDDPTPRATAGQRWRAWFHEVRSAPAVFCWRQPFRSHRWPNHLPARANEAPGVLFIHGFVCNRGIWNPWLQRLTTDHVAWVAVNLEPIFGSIDLYIPQIEAGIQALERSSGTAPIVVAHSMGGLALRRWWIEPGNAERIRHAITIGTPHHGTWLARFALTPNAREMRRHSDWLTKLQAREPSDRAHRCTCFYSHCDNIVFPPATATLQGADNRHLPGVAHVQMADRQEPWDELQRLLRSAGTLKR
jgi:triacylglycerol lipase